MFGEPQSPESRLLSRLKTMKTVRFRTEVDPDVQYPPDRFRDEVTIYLHDPEGWARFHHFEYAPSGPAKVIRLASKRAIKAAGCVEDELSCAILGGKDIWLNADRWVHGAPKSKLPLQEYRQYMVTHEMGHSLGYEHAKCPGSGPVPVMVQQTLGIGACTPNTKVTEIDLRMK
jgi:hypothetical protein